MDLLDFERKLDQNVEDLKIIESRKETRTLRIFVSNETSWSVWSGLAWPGLFPPEKVPESIKNSQKLQKTTIGSDDKLLPQTWQLRVGGRLLDKTDENNNVVSRSGTNRIFSSFFESIAVELDKEIYGGSKEYPKFGFEWNRSANNGVCHGVKLDVLGTKKSGDLCTISLLEDSQPLKFKLDQNLAQLFAPYQQFYQSKPAVMSVIWEYIKTKKLQDPNEREFVNCDSLFGQIFQTNRIKLMELPQRLDALCYPPDPIVIQHLATWEAPNQMKTAFYDIDVEVAI